MKEENHFREVFRNFAQFCARFIGVTFCLNSKALDQFKGKMKKTKNNDEIIISGQIVACKLSGVQIFGHNYVSIELEFLTACTE